MANRKTTLTGKIEENTYKRLKLIVSSGKVSEIINRLIEKWIGEEEKKIANDYQSTIKEKCYDEQWKSWYLIHRKKLKLDKENEESK